MTEVPAPSVPPVVTSRRWLLFAFLTVGLWGVWGAFAGISAQRGFPETLVYCVWALTMVLPAVVVMQRAGWRLDRDPRSIFYGLLIGLTGLLLCLPRSLLSRHDFHLLPFAASSGGARAGRRRRRAPGRAVGARAP